MRYDRITRWLHAGIAFGITLQMLLSLIMIVPDGGEVATGLGAGAFKLHEATGIGLCALIALHWLWSLSGHVTDGLGHLFPWFSKRRLSLIMEECKEVARLRLSDPEQKNQLAGAVHGLGLLTATVMAATGLIMVVSLAKGRGLPAPLEDIAIVHETFAVLVWGYLIGHVGMTILHWRRGHSSVWEIFALFR